MPAWSASQKSVIPFQYQGRPDAREFSPELGMICRHGADSAVGFVPTGWTYQTKTESFPVHEKPPFKIHLIPYSEHSSFTELLEFVGFLKPRKVIPTVGVSGDRGDASAHKMAGYFKHLCDNNGALRSFLGPMAAQASANAAGTQASTHEHPSCKVVDVKSISRQGPSDSEDIAKAMCEQTALEDGVASPATGSRKTAEETQTGVEGSTKVWNHSTVGEQGSACKPRAEVSSPTRKNDYMSAGNVPPYSL